MTRMPETMQERVRVPVGGPGPAAGGLTAGDYLRIIRQRMLLIIFVWFLLIGATVGGTAAWIKYIPGYRAIGQIQIVSITPGRLLEEGAEPLRVDLMDRLLEDQSVLLKSDTVLRATLEDPRVRNTSWYKAFEDDVDEAQLTLEDDLRCVPMRGTSFVRVQMECRRPEDPHQIINTVLEKYQDIADKRFSNRFEDELRVVTARASNLQTQLDAMRNNRRRFMTEEMAGAGAVWGDNAITMRHQMLAQQVSLAEQEERLAYSQYQLYANRSPTDLAVTPEIQQMVENDPTVAGLNNRLLQLEEERRSWTMEGYLPNHRYIKKIKARIETTTADLNQKRSELVSDLQRQFTALAQNAWMNANMTVTDLREQYEYAAAEQRDLATKMLTYDNMLEEERRLQEDYTKAETYRQELDLTIKAKQTFQVQHTRAVPPKERSTPRWLVNLFVGTAGGLLAAVGLAMLLEFADTSIRTGRDMVRHVRRQLLGIIPDLDDEEVAIDDITSVVRNAPNSMVAEAFRAVRTNLERSAPADERRTLLVTSPRPDDGKTAIAVNLAVAQANNHRRVLLVDANFRKPALHQVFKLPGARGLSDLLAGQGSLETLVAPSGVDRLDVLCCGRIPSNPVEQLGSPAMQSLIDAAAGKYDQVIFDGPPLLLVSDALVVAGAVDGVILVTRAKANSRGVVLRARDGLEHVNARILGTVLNAAQVRRGGYYREQYRAFYDYQAADAGGIATMPASPNTRADDDDNPEPS